MKSGSDSYRFGVCSYERYWLKEREAPWREVTRAQFISAEGNACFHPKPGCGPVATGGFCAAFVQGRVTYGEITEDVYRWDPEFLKVAKAS